MGHVANITFKSVGSRSPTIYLHWNEQDTVAWLIEAGPTLRKGDQAYAAARFCGFCHGKIDGSLSLGLYNSDRVMDGEEYEVDVDTGVVTRRGAPVATLSLYEG